MSTFVIAYITFFDNEIIQKLVTAGSKEEAICEFLSDQGWDITLDDCFGDINDGKFSDMFITAMEVSAEMDSEHGVRSTLYVKEIKQK